MSKIFLDFDNTIVNSTKSFCETYSELYQDHPNFILPKWEEVNCWNFENQCTLLKTNEDVEKIFSMELFFIGLEFIDEYTYKILKELNEKYQIIITSIGTYDNITYKSQWVKGNLPFIKDSIFLINNGCKMNKSVVNMQDSIFIDDVTTNLDSSNAVNKYIFGKEYPWSQTNDYHRLWNWTDVAKELL